MRNRSLNTWRFYCISTNSTLFFQAVSGWKMSKADIITVHTTVVFPSVARRGSVRCSKLILSTIVFFGLKWRFCRSSVEPNYNWVRQKHVFWVGPYLVNINFKTSCKKHEWYSITKGNDVFKQAAPYQNCCDLCSFKVKFTCPSHFLKLKSAHYVTYEILLCIRCLLNN